MAELLSWSVERDGDAVIVTCPEPLRYASESPPEWMGRCASALRDELRRLEIGDGTILEATLTDDPPLGADLADILLSTVGVPESQVHAGVRLRRKPGAGGGVSQHYRRLPVAVAGSDDGEQPLAAVTVALGDGHELETAREVWLAARRAVVAALPEGPAAPPGAIGLRVRLTTGPGRLRGSVDLIKKLLDGACASLHVYAGANLGEVAQRLARELGEDAEAMSSLAASPRGALLGPCDCFRLVGERVQVSPADDRIRALDVTVLPGPEMRLEIELRALPAG